MSPFHLTTAVVIVASHEVQAIAVPILREYALDTLIRVPAHLTLLYPFVQYEQLEAACQKLRAVCAEITPFDITMDGYDHFPTVAFMKPADPQPLREVFRRLYAVFPECPPYRGQFGYDIHPHMTVGEFDSEADRSAVPLPAYSPTTFRAERAHILYGIDEEALPWITYDVIPFGKEPSFSSATNEAVVRLP